MSLRVTCSLTLLFCVPLFKLRLVGGLSLSLSLQVSDDLHELRVRAATVAAPLSVVALGTPAGSTHPALLPQCGLLGSYCCMLRVLGAASARLESPHAPHVVNDEVEKLLAMVRTNKTG